MEEETKELILTTIENRINSSQEQFFKKIRNVFYGFLATVLLSLLGFAYWLGKIDNRITQNTEAIKLTAKYDLFLEYRRIGEEVQKRNELNFDLIRDDLTELDRVLKDVLKESYRGIKIKEYE